MNFEDLKKSIICSIIELLQNDSMLFDNIIEEDNREYDPRKLHEVCINHRLATYLEKNLIETLENNYQDNFFVDIEFNREGRKAKYLNGQVYRPDIIIHNRKSGKDKNNFLIVECKKDTTEEKIKNDREKIKAFMKDEVYRYQFGMQVIYLDKNVNVTLFFKENDTIKEDRFTL